MALSRKRELRQAGEPGDGRRRAEGSRFRTVSASEVRGRNKHVIDQWFSDAARGPCGDVLERRILSPTPDLLNQKPRDWPGGLFQQALQLTLMQASI